MCQNRMGGNLSNLEKHEFIHIPKTGGSSIEEAFKVQGYGVAKYDDRTRRKSCSYHSPNRLEPSLPTWCIFRDPLERFVSEHKWQSDKKKHTSTWNGPRECTPESLNRHVHEAYEMQLQHKTTGHCHYLPQSAYDCDVRLSFDDLDRNVIKFARDHMSIDLPSIPWKNVRKEKCPLTPHDLSPESQALLRSMYHDDFSIQTQSLS